jgi:hypothetical protein
MVEWLAGNRIKGTSTERTTGTTTYSTIAKDNQAIIQRGSATPSSGQGGTGLVSGTFSNFAVGNNSNRVLIIASGCYNAAPNITGVTFNGSENFEKITQYKPASGFNHEFWILYNPTVTTADVVITYGTSSGFEAGAGQTGAICYSFYGVKQSDAFGTPVEKNSGASATPFIAITPTTAGSMIIDCYFSGAGSPVPNNDETDGMNIICGGVDRSMASQYDLSPTIGSANNMSRTSGNSSYSQIAVEIKAFATVIPSLMPSLQSPSVGGWHEIGRTTLGTANSDIDVTGLADKQYLMILSDFQNPSSGEIPYFRAGNGSFDSGTNYASRSSSNGASPDDYSVASNHNAHFRGAGLTTPHFDVCYISNLSGKEKLGLWWNIERNTAGHGASPNRDEGAFKHDYSNPYDQIQRSSLGSTTYASGSEVVVLGWDPSDTHTTNFWEQLDSFNGTGETTMTGNSFTPKKYLWIQGYLKSTSSTITPLLKLGSGGTVDTTGNYSLTYSFNGLSPVPMTNTTAGLGFFYTTHGSGDGIFFNTFIINKSGQDKLCISHIVDGANPPDRTSLYSKWVPTDTSDQANIVGVDQWSGSGTFSTDSIIKVWGHD